MRCTWILLVGITAACSGGDDGPDDSGDVGGDDTGWRDTGEPPPPLGGYLAGTVTDSTGAPVVSARVSLCATVCRTADTDDNGQYHIDGMDELTYAFDVIPDDDSLASPLITVTSEFQEERTLDISLHTLSERQNILNNATEMELTDGLFVKLGYDVLDMGFSTETTTSAVQVPETGWPSIEVEGTVKAVWYLAPWDVGVNTDVASSLQFRMSNTWGWEAGATIEAWQASYEHIAWESVGTMTVSADGTELTLTEGDGLNVLTTLVLVEPAAEDGS